MSVDESMRQLVERQQDIIADWMNAAGREKARADVAERECAELHDALDKARGLIDDALAKVRRRDQVAGWDAARAAVEAARRG